MLAEALRRARARRGRAGRRALHGRRHARRRATSRRSPFIPTEAYGAEGPHRAARRLRHRRGRHRHRPHRDRVRRGRLPARRRSRGSTSSTRSRLDGTYDERIGPYAGPLGQGRRPGPDRGPARARAAAARRDLPALLPALLALRHAAALLRQAVVVHPHVARARPPAGRQRDRRLAPGAHQARALRALAARTTSTGRSRASATGARRCRCGAATNGHVGVHRLVRGAGGASRA